MAADFVVRGAEDFLRLSKALKDAGQTELRKELHNAMKRTARPLVRAAKESAVADSGIPRSGGLAKKIARTGFRAQVRTGAKTAGLSVNAPGRFVTAGLLNRTGAFRHPVYGDPTQTRKEWAWAPQQAPAALGWFDRAMEAEGPAVRRAVFAAMAEVAEKVVRDARA